MREFETSLLREKFIIHDPNAKAQNKASPVIALSNRIVAELKSSNGDLEETFIIRTQNMHSCTRMTAKIIQAFQQGGALLSRSNPYDWKAAWNVVVNEYESSYNEDRWIAIYNNGRVIFESGNRHPLLDVIEKCAALNRGAYDDSIPMAEDAFKQAGKVVKIEYDGNVALVINLEVTHGRCGVILRGANKTTTFNFSVEPHAENFISFAQCLTAAAAFLEGIQMAFMVGMNNEKIRMGIIERHSKEEKQTKEGKRRLSRLNAEIANLESTFDVNYRPERPEFQHIIMDAEKLAQKTLEPPEGSGFIK